MMGLKKRMKLGRYGLVLLDCKLHADEEMMWLLRGVELIFIDLLFICILCIF